MPWIPAPNVLYAGLQRLRLPYRFQSGGPDGGIFKSTDGGQTWRKLTRGLPTGDLGKIEIDVSRSDPRILVAMVEHGLQLASDRPDFADITKLGSGLYRSENGGESWTYVNRSNPPPFYYSHIWIDPRNPNRVYQLAEDALVSENGGRTFDRQFPGIEGDFHALWIDPRDSDHLYVGNDKGASTSFDGGRNLILFDNIDAAQFCHQHRICAIRIGSSADCRTTDRADPATAGTSTACSPITVQDAPGDGMHTANDPLDWHRLYVERERQPAPHRRHLSPSAPPSARCRARLNLGQVLPAVIATGTQLSREFFRSTGRHRSFAPHDSHPTWAGTTCSRAPIAATAGASSVRILAPLTPPLTLRAAHARRQRRGDACQRHHYLRVTARARHHLGGHR